MTCTQSILNVFNTFFPSQNSKGATLMSTHAIDLLQTPPDVFSCLCFRQICLCQRSPFARLVFLDWDDTMLSSTFLLDKGYKPTEVFALPQELAEELELLETTVIDFLNFVSTTATTYIVTNSSNGWVQLSAKCFFPRLASLLDQFPVISARSLYEGRFPNRPLEWKKACFEQLFNEFRKGKPQYGVYECISVGDSEADRKGILHLQQLYPHIICKCVKLVESPTPFYLRKQLELLRVNLMTLLRHHQTIDLNVSVKQT
ncbi:hypothetical protein RCL1_002837 [Eukaryota sp. TZLM3-RCL]